MLSMSDHWQDPYLSHVPVLPIAKSHSRVLPEHIFIMFSAASILSKIVQSSQSVGHSCAFNLVPTNAELGGGSTQYLFQIRYNL